AGVGAFYDYCFALAVAPARCSALFPYTTLFRSREVVDGNVVGPGQRPKLDVLDIVEVHRDVGDVAEEADPRAVGGDVDVLADVGAKGQHHIVAALPLHGVAASAGGRLEDVGAGAHERLVVTLVA